MSTLRPAYPRGPWHYKDMHQLVVTYESTAEAVRAVVPRPLQPAEGNRVTIEWRHMTEVSGFGPYTEVGHSVACTFEGKPVIYVFQAFLDSESPTLAGREILGFPKRHGEPELKTIREVLTGTLTYGGVQVALATMPYRAVDLSDRLAEIEQELQTTQLVLKLLPDVDNHTPKVAQLVRVGIYDVRLKGAWGGPAELFMVPHVGCPVAALPVVRVARRPPASLGHDPERWSSRTRLPENRALLGSIKKSNSACGAHSTPITGELNMNLLKGKAAVVTGAASGIGKAIATAFVDAGASVLLCDLNAKALDDAARDLGNRAIGRVTDVSDESQVEGAMRAAREAFGSLDIVVNCAGFGAIAPLTELTGDKWKAVQAVTLGGVFYGVKHGARQMLEQGRPGVIINISSVNARQPGEGQVAYCAAKAGVDMITRCGALELGGRGIRVVGIAPGLVETPLTRKELEDPAMRELFLSIIPMRRPVAAEEIAAAAVFLASDHARSINGDTIAIDGGSLTRGYPALLTGLKKAA